jgi:hypothetical protein
VHHAANDDEGRPFAADVWPIEALERTRRELAEVDPSERLWQAQFQNNPFVPGREVFGEPARYVELPAYHGFRDAIGLDMSYSMAASADYFALVVGRAYGGALFLRRSRRTHADINAIEVELRDAMAVYGQMPVYSYVSGPEIGAVHYLASRGIRMQGIPARFNKLVRAQRTRVDWNGGKVQIPAPEPARDEWGLFIRRVQVFRGAESDADDEVDALVSLHDGIMGMSSGAPITMGRPRY